MRKKVERGSFFQKVVILDVGATQTNACPCVVDLRHLIDQTFHHVQRIFF